LEPPPTLDVPRASEEIHIDGRLNEASWAHAASSGPLVDPFTGAQASESNAHGSVRVLWDPQNLYMAWDVTDSFIVDPEQVRDAPVWNADGVEFMIDPGGDGLDYYQVLVSPHNHVLDALHTAAPRPDGHIGRGDVSFNADVRSATIVRAGSGQEAGEEAGYVVEMSIPWRDLRGGPRAPLVANVGDTHRANFYLDDMTRTQRLRFASWARVANQSFHDTPHFGVLHLVAATPQ
jgi:hypothetical protein